MSYEVHGCGSRLRVAVLLSQSASEMCGFVSQRSACLGWLRTGRGKGGGRGINSRVLLRGHICLANTYFIVSATAVCLGSTIPIAICLAFNPILPSPSLSSFTVVSQAFKFLISQIATSRRRMSGSDPYGAQRDSGQYRNGTAGMSCRPRSGREEGEGSHAREIELKRSRGEVSCAECRRCV